MLTQRRCWNCASKLCNGWSDDSEDDSEVEDGIIPFHSRFEVKRRRCSQAWLWVGKVQKQEGGG